MGNETSGYYQDCVISGPGEINIDFNFDETFGKFYFNYKLTYPGLDNSCRRGPVLDVRTGGSDDRVIIPPQTISYNLVGENTGDNLPPTPPTIEGDTSGLTDKSYTFQIKDGIDPEGEQIRYQIDWNNDGTVNQFTDWTNSGGTITTLPKTWSTPGTYTFKARTDDNQFVSDWTTHTITITQNPVDPFEPGNGGGNPFNVSCSVSETDRYLTPGQSTTFTANTSNADGNVSYKWTGIDDGSTYNTKTFTYTAPSTYGTYQYQIEATDDSDTDSTSCSINVNETGELPTGPINDPENNFRLSPLLEPCKAYFKVEGVTSCVFNTQTIPADANNVVEVNGSIEVDVGSYKLTCTKLDGTQFTTSEQRCISNPGIIEQ